MILIDVHAHLDHPWFTDIDEVIEKARKNGVKKIITSGFDKKTNRNALKLSEKYDIVECTLGIYPLDVLRQEYKDENVDFEEFDIDEEIEFIRMNKDRIQGIGEVGMDFSREDIDPKYQEEIFIKMIHLAKEMNKPLVVHSRKAEKECLDVLKRENAKKVVMHCFSGKKALIEEGGKRGYYFSVPANVNRSSNFQTLVSMINTNQLLTETDAPYLSPKKGEINDSSNVIVAIREIAKIKGFEEIEVANNIYMNYQRLF